MVALFWGTLHALVALFAALRLFPSMDRSFGGTWAFFLLGLSAGTFLALRSPRQAHSPTDPDPISPSFRKGIILRLSATWIAGYVGSGILTRSRGAPAIFLPWDYWIELSPAWTPIYLTAFPMVALPVLLLRRRRDLQELAWSFTFTIAISAAIFLAYPMEVPRPSLGAEHRFSSWALETVYRFDSTHNALPSLHAGLGLCCCLASFRIRKSVGLYFSALLAVFCISTIAVRQHVVLDLLAGFAVAGAARALAARWVNRQLRPPAAQFPA
ncbi:MAG: phosphatase PAP2 family protein [Acidobacteria bacterium]|nr:phosphatase PAP2 family protein [Acidobacteriota bacterium]